MHGRCRAQKTASKLDGFNGTCIKTDFSGKYCTRQACAFDLGFFASKVVRSEAGHTIGALQSCHKLFKAEKVTTVGGCGCIHAVTSNKATTHHAGLGDWQGSELAVDVAKRGAGCSSTNYHCDALVRAWAKPTLAFIQTLCTLTLSVACSSKPGSFPHIM